MHCWSLVVLYLSIVAAISSLVEINDHNFDKLVIKSGDFVLVDFYADWCRHCKQLMPTIEKLADVYATIEGVKIYKINGGARSGKRMVLKYDIDGFPMLALFHGDDEPIMYEGSRDFESINNFIQAASGIRTEVADTDSYLREVDPEDVILDINDYNIEPAVLTSDKKTLLLVSGHWCTYCKEVYPIIEKLSKIYANEPTFQVGVVALDNEGGTTNKIKKQFDIKGIPSILFFDPAQPARDGMRRPELYEGAKNLKSLVKYINEKTGLTRQTNGRLTSTKGKIPEVDKILKKIYRDPEDITESIKVLAQLNKHEDEGEDPFVIAYYKKLVSKVIDKDFDFVKKEQKRLKKLIKNQNNLQYKAMDKIELRLNILDSFMKNR